LGGDRIQDFDVRDDKFVFSASGFDGLDAGQQLIAGQTFIANKTPTALANTDGIGVFLYDTDDFDLRYDADGSGSGDPLQIAHFDTAVALTANHFIIA
jgi:hypothetical protein